MSFSACSLRFISPTTAFMRNLRRWIATTTFMSMLPVLVWIFCSWAMGLLAVPPPIGAGVPFFPPPFFLIGVVSKVVSFVGFGCMTFRNSSKPISPLSSLSTVRIRSFTSCSVLAMPVESSGSASSSTSTSPDRSSSKWSNHFLSALFCFTVHLQSEARRKLD
jgi:hypothetical protein